MGFRASIDCCVNHVRQMNIVDEFTDALQEPGVLFPQKIRPDVFPVGQMPFQLDAVRSAAAST